MGLENEMKLSSCLINQTASSALLPFSAFQTQEKPTENQGQEVRCLDGVPALPRPSGVIVEKSLILPKAQLPHL